MAAKSNHKRMPLEFSIRPGYIFADEPRSPLNASAIEKLATPIVEVSGELDEIIPITKPHKIDGDIPSDKIVDGSVPLSKLPDGFLFHDGEDWQASKASESTYLTIHEGLPVWQEIGFEKVVVRNLPPPPLHIAAVKEDGTTPIFASFTVDYVRIPVNGTASATLDAGRYFASGDVTMSGEGVTGMTVADDDTDVTMSGQGILYRYEPLN